MVLKQNFEVLDNRLCSKHFLLLRDNIVSCKWEYYVSHLSKIIPRYLVLEVLGVCVLLKVMLKII